MWEILSKKSTNEEHTHLHLLQDCLEGAVKLLWVSGLFT